MTGSGSIARSKIDRVEQAIAFGRSLDWMREHLAVTDEQVRSAYSRLEAAYRAPEMKPAPKAKPRVRRARCGTSAGAQAHRRWREPSCDECRRAERELAAEKRAAARGAVA